MKAHMSDWAKRLTQRQVNELLARGRLRVVVDGRVMVLVLGDGKPA